MRTTALMLLALVATPAAAQRNGRAEVGFSYQQWDIQDTVSRGLSQTAAPIRLDLPLGSRFGLLLRAVPGRTTLDVSDQDLVGVGNAVLKASWYVWDTVMLRAGVSVPLGATELTDDEAAIASLVATDELGLAMDSPGEGVGATVGVAWAHNLRSFTVALGAGYTLRTAYRPYSALEGRLDPGEEAVLTAGVYRRFRLGETPALLKADGVVVIYQADQWEDKEFRKLGRRIEVRTVLTVSSGALDHLELGLWGRSRGTGEVMGDAGLVAESGAPKGNEGVASVKARYGLSSGLALEGDAGFRIHGDNDFGYGGGSVLTVAAGPRLRLSRTLSLSILGGVSTGSVRSRHGDIDLSGYDVRSAIVAAWR